MLTADLNIIFISDTLKALPVPHQVRQLDMYGGAEGSAEISRAGCDVAEVLGVRELCDLFDGSSSPGESLEDRDDIVAGLHGDDAQLVLFVHPDEESLVVVQEDTTSARPVTVESGCVEESVTLFEQEVIIDELLLILAGHAFERVELAAQVTIECIAGLNYLVHDLQALLFRDAWTKRVALEVAADAYPRRQNHILGLFGEWSNCLSERVRIHIGLVLVVRFVSMVVLNDFIEELGELSVALGTSSVDTDARVGVLAAREYALLEGDATLVRLHLVFVPDVHSQVLREER